MKPIFRDSEANDFDQCVKIRGMTRDNAIPADVLIEYGVTRESWISQIKDGRIVGVVAEVKGDVVGFCNGDSKTGEILVLAILPDFEGRRIATKMLDLVKYKLFSLGFEKLWLGASPDPGIRAHGFYRHLGWVATGEFDKNGDQVLEYRKT